MDHALYRYSALPARAAAALSPGLRAYALLFLEHWELEPPAQARRDPRLVGEFGSFAPDFRSWSQREYGLRIGIFRVIDALKQAGITPAIAANAMALQRLPGLAQQLDDWGCEWVAHGIAATRMMHSGMSLEEQREHIERSVSCVRDVTGRVPMGWLSQDWGTTPDTGALLAQAGIRYTLDWSNDDQPYWMQTTPPLLNIPLASEWDDVQCQWLRQLEPRAHADLALAAFERLRQECQQHRRVAVFGLALHPWLCGMPSRIAALRDMLGRMKAHDDVVWIQPGTLLESKDWS